MWTGTIPGCIAVVLRLRRLRPAPAAGHLPVVHGDLKPDHVVFPDRADGRPVFLDPGLGRGRLQTDPAKLISRTVLGLIASSPDLVTARTTATGIEEFTDVLTADLAPDERAEWLRYLMVLWLMDTTNILSTYLTCPPDLPLPEHAGRLTARAETVCGLLEITTAGLIAGADPQAAWRIALADVVKAANR
ncbi:hypothetical protein I5Q34_32245 [Streptomyces sp. AV19]|uniref:hypothetical protein n=1 Tax=Streptomyces sp. AV19 TaxID=2793068 RepID=UPI0018FEB5FB|nr:hypothetical protein [Streptomyces sp. AV19]MBH1938878.1 hypothetical protein [Streptomyces sp. AV19]MDG4533503.1 hypothetical protein [Streptomyces sp. AV19]